MRVLQQIVIATAVLTLPASIFAQESDRMFYVKVTKETNQLSGQLTDITEFKLETSFGNVTIPLDKIEAVRLRADGEDRSVIALNNGDMITGKIDLDELHLKTNWGKAHIKSDSLESFSVSPYGRFYTDPSQGGWRYSRGNAPNAAQQNQPFRGNSFRGN